MKHSIPALEAGSTMPGQENPGSDSQSRVYKRRHSFHMSKFDSIGFLLSGEECGRKGTRVSTGHRTGGPLVQVMGSTALSHGCAGIQLDFFFSAQVQQPESYPVLLFTLQTSTKEWDSFGLDGRANVWEALRFVYKCVEWGQGVLVDFCWEELGDWARQIAWSVWRR